MSHSVTSDMHVIQQENPFKSAKGRLFAADDEDNGCITSRSSLIICCILVFGSYQEGSGSVPGSWGKGIDGREGLIDTQSISWGVSLGAPLLVRIKPQVIFPPDGKMKGKRRAGRRTA